MKCCLCGNEIKGFGNNPEPLTDDGRCCDVCNENVIKFRMLVTYDNLKMAHPKYNAGKLRQLYEDLRIQTRHKCMIGEKI